MRRRKRRSRREAGRRGGAAADGRRSRPDRGSPMRTKVTIDAALFERVGRRDGLVGPLSPVDLSAARNVDGQILVKAEAAEGTGRRPAFTRIWPSTTIGGRDRGRSADSSWRRSESPSFAAARETLVTSYGRGRTRSPTSAPQESPAPRRGRRSSSARHRPSAPWSRCACADAPASRRRRPCAASPRGDGRASRRRRAA